MRYTIAIEGGLSFTMDAQEDSLLRGALRAGVGLPHECSVGGCGACRFELLSGTLQTLWPEAPGLSERDRRRGKHLACQSRPDGDCTVKLRCDETYQLRHPPLRRAVRLVERQALTHDLCEFSFALPEQARFSAGQYALLYLPGVMGARAYSMSNAPQAEGQGDAVWCFVVRRTPTGNGSRALFEQLHVGDTVELDGPYGHAYLRETLPRPVVCIGGGSGLAPMVSIARAALAEPGIPQVHFFYGGRSQADLGAIRLMDDLADQPRLRLTIALSAPEAEPAWEGATGFIHTQLESRLDQPLTDYEYYFAGPPAMADAVQTLLLHTHQVPFAQIHFDRFV